VLERLATTCGIRVAETAPSFLNIPRDSPAFAGFDGAALAAEADLGLLLDVDVPWVPKIAPRAGTPHWIQIDVDPVKRDFPLWGFPADLRAAADCATALMQVLAVVEARADAAFRARVAARTTGWEAANAARRARLATAAADAGTPDAIPPDYVCAALARQLRPDDIVVNEAVRAIPSVLNHIPRTVPGTYFMSAGGGLGAGGGTALGLRLAHPDRRVVLVCGDGAFGFGNPDSVYAVAAQYGLPMLTVILDNRGWKAVKEAVLRVHPDGAAASSDEFQARLDGRQQGAMRRFEEIGRAFGAHGERVSDPAGLDAAIARCLAALDGGRAAVLTVRTAAL
jgi:acetolactate synthase-1/2/3 large subunit